MLLKTIMKTLPMVFSGLRIIDIKRAKQGLPGMLCIVIAKINSMILLQLLLAGTGGLSLRVWDTAGSSG